MTKQYPLNDFAVLRVTGKKAEELMQGQLTCNISEISETNGSLAAHCDRKGQVISLFHIIRQQDDFLLILPKEMLDICRKELMKYAMLYRVNVEPDNTLSVIGTLNEAISTTHVKIDSNRYLNITSKLPTANNQPDSDWHRLNLLAGIPTIYLQTSGQFVPHRLNLEKLSAISFDKGCYTGQEIIARMHYRGNNKHHMYLAEITDKCDIQPLDEIYTDTSSRATGQVIDVSQNEEKPTLILLTTKEEYVKNSTLYLDQQHSLTAKILPLPQE